MENEEVTQLLLAAQVREIAKELRKNAAAVAFRSNRSSAEQTFDNFHGRFASENALTQYVPKALEELRDIAAAFNR